MNNETQRIMQEAYTLADRNDTEGYNSVKIMCSEVQNLLHRTWIGLTDEDLNYLCHLAYTGDEEFALAVQAKLKEKNT